MTRSFVHRIGRRNLLICAIVGCLVIASVVIGLSLDHGSAPASNNTRAAGNQAGGNHGRNASDVRPGRSVCGQKILHSPFTYDGAPGSYSTGRPGLPTYGAPGSDFPNATAGVILPAGTHDYASYQLAPNTVYYLLPGVHIGSLQANENDAFVGGLANGQSTILSGEYGETHWAIDSNASIGNQADVTVEYLTVEKSAKRQLGRHQSRCQHRLDYPVQHDHS